MEPRFEFKLTSKLWVLVNSTSKVFNSKKKKKKKLVKFLIVE